MLRPFLLLPLLLAVPANACLNDRDSDSLAKQAKQLPDTLRVITGRFERNPPLYYQMRIRRSLPLLKQNPKRFELYDDIAVAYDRLHRDEDALAIMRLKRAALPAYDWTQPEVKEAWYRYCANTGTFYAHRWLGAGAKPESLSEMKRAQALIERAIQIKPNAHFGREKYQLITMKWIISTRQNPRAVHRTLGQFIAHEDGRSDEVDYFIDSEAVEGLSGLVVLGAAWQSVDIFEALGEALRGQEGVSLRYLALLRCRELMRSGQKSFSPATLNEKSVANRIIGIGAMATGNFYINGKNKRALDELYPKLRAEADSWSKERNSYMLASLEKGSHPDTDRNFWDTWNPSDPPSTDIPWWDDKAGRYSGGSRLSQVSLAGGLTVLLGTLAASLLTLRLLSRRRLV